MLPGMASQLARCNPKNNMAKLRALKNKEGPITESDGSGLTADGELEYLGELAAEKDGNWALALTFWRRMKSERIY